MPNGSSSSRCCRRLRRWGGTGVADARNRQRDLLRAARRHSVADAAALFSAPADCLRLVRRVARWVGGRPPRTTPSCRTASGPAARRAPSAAVIDSQSVGAQLALIAGPTEHEHCPAKRQSLSRVREVWHPPACVHTSRGGHGTPHRSSESCVIYSRLLIVPRTPGADRPRLRSSRASTGCWSSDPRKTAELSTEASCPQWPA